jgi:hypothetical protein
MEAHATMIKAMNKALQLVVTKMKEDSEILTADTLNMDPSMKAWYMMARNRSPLN